MVEETDGRLLITVEEAAERLGIGRTLAWELVRAGALPSVRLGRCVRIPLVALEEWIADRVAQGGHRWPADETTKDRSSATRTIPAPAR